LAPSPYYNFVAEEPVVELILVFILKTKNHMEIKCYAAVPDIIMVPKGINYNPSGIIMIFSTIA